MKIVVPTTKLKDIGKLDITKKLPMERRIARGMKSICDRCKKPITDEYFIAGFKKGYKNMMFHESCMDDE